MKRPLFFSILAFLAGIYSAYFLPGAAAVFLVGAVVCLFVLVAMKKLSSVYCILCLSGLLGFFYLTFSDAIEKRPFYPYVNEYVTLSGNVIEEPQIDEESHRATLLAEVKSLAFLNEEILGKEKIRLTLKAGEPVPAFGESFRAVCFLKLPESAENHGGFDYELYLKSKEIYFLASVEEGTMEITGTFSLGIWERMYGLNRRVGEVLQSLFPEEEASVLQAISLGDKTDMPAALYDALKISGLVHVTTVSGMHVTTLLLIVYYLLLVFKQNRFNFFLPLIGLVLLFMLFTGCSPSVVRASIMCVLSLGAYLLYRKEDPLTSLGIAGGVIALVNPFLVFDTGFILSFAATLGILLFAKPLTEAVLSLFSLKEAEGIFKRSIANIVTLLCVSLSAQLMLLPLSAWIFGTTSLWTFLTTLLVTPLLPVLLIGGLLIGFLGLLHPWLSMPLVGIVYLYAKVFVMIAKGFGSLAFGVVPLVRVTLFGAYLYALFLFGGYFALKRKWTFALFCGGACTFLIYGLFCLQLLFPVAQITYINVGQGDCSLIQLPGRQTILLDGGGLGYETDYDVGEEVVLPYLRRQGIRQLTYVVASHPHADHIGGLKAVIETMPVETLLIPDGFCNVPEGEAFVSLAKEQGIHVEVVSAGWQLELGKDTELACLLPNEEWLSLAESENDCSLVCLLRFGESVALFPGDLESGGEAYLTEVASLEEIDLLKVSHHGSETSSQQEFLEDIKPAYAFIPCGENNFGHPAEGVLRRFSNAGTVVYRADYDKDVTFTLTKTGVRSVRTGGD